MSHTLESIRMQFAQQRRERKARHRDIAEQLGISEGELIAAHVGATAAADGDGVLRAVRLNAQWPTLLESLEPLGEVLALTRNPSCVHEKTGVYRQASHQGQMGLVLAGEIDLRIFYRQWAHGFAVSEDGERGPQRSLQFFDAQGNALHKIFLQPQSDVAAYQGLAELFGSEDQDCGMSVMAAKPVEPERPDSEIDIDSFRAAWRGLRDTHDFFGMLRQFGLSRTQALRLAPPGYAQPVEPTGPRDLLEAAAREKVAIMVFVGNPGMIQIHTGPVRKVAIMGPWLNVLDPGFNLHLREDHVASAWIVRKPTVDGLVTSLELYDAQGQTLAMLFGARKPGKPELCEWRALIDDLARESELCAA